MSYIGPDEWKNYLSTLPQNATSDQLVELVNGQAQSIPAMLQSLSDDLWTLPEQSLAKRLISIIPSDARSTREYQLFVLQLQKGNVLDLAQVRDCFSFACEHGDNDFAIALIEAGLPVLGEVVEESPLHQATRFNRVEVLKAVDRALTTGLVGWKNMLLPPKQDLPEGHRWGPVVSPMAYACRHGSTDALAYLLDTRGLEEGDQVSLLLEGVRAKKLGVVQFLLSRLNWVHLSAPKRGELLDVLVKSQDVAILEAILEKGIFSGDDLIHEVCQTGNVEMLRLFLDAGAKPNLVSSSGHLPFYHLFKRDLEQPETREMAILLLEAGADLSLSSGGEGLLSRAAKAKQSKQLWSVWLEVFEGALKEQLTGPLLGAGETCDWPVEGLPYYLRPSESFSCIELISKGADEKQSLIPLGIKDANSVVEQVQSILFEILVCPTLEKECPDLRRDQLELEIPGPRDVWVRVDSVGKEVHLDYFDFENSIAKRETFSALDLKRVLQRHQELKIQQEQGYVAELAAIQDYAGKRWKEKPKTHCPDWGQWHLGLEKGGDRLWFTGKNGFCVGKINVLRPKEFSLVKLKEMEKSLDQATLAWEALKGCYSASLLEPGKQPSLSDYDSLSTQNLLIQPSDDYSHFKIYISPDYYDVPEWVPFRSQGLDDVMKIVGFLFKINHSKRLYVLRKGTPVTSDLFSDGGEDWMYLQDNPQRGYPILHYLDRVSGEVAEVTLNEVCQDPHSLEHDLWQFRAAEKRKAKEEIKAVKAEFADCLAPNSKVVRDPQSNEILGEYSFDVVREGNREVYRFYLEGRDGVHSKRELITLGRESVKSACKSIEEGFALAKCCRDIAMVPGVVILDKGNALAKQKKALDKGKLVVTPDPRAKRFKLQLNAPNSEFPITLQTRGLDDWKERIAELRGFTERLQAWEPDLRGLNRPSPPQAEIPAIEEEVNFSGYLEAFDALNFSDPSKDDYRDPENLFEGGMHCSVKYLRSGVQDMVQMLQNAGGAAGISDEKVNVYEEMQVLAKHILIKLPDLDPDMQASILLDFARMGKVCGPQRRLDLRISYALVSGNFNAVGDQNFDGQMLQLRDSVLSGVVERMMWETGTDQPEHVMNYIRETLDFEGVALPEAEKELMEDDPWAVTYGAPHFGEPHEVWEHFNGRYWIALMERIHEDANRRIQQEGPRFISLLEQVLLDFIEEHYLNPKEKKDLEGVMIPLRAQLHATTKAATALQKAMEELKATSSKEVWTQADELLVKRAELKIAVQMLKRAPSNEVLQKRAGGIQRRIKELEGLGEVKEAAVLLAEAAVAKEAQDLAREKLEDAKRQALSAHLKAAQLIEISEDRQQAELRLDGALALARQFGFVKPKPAYGKTWYESIFGSVDKGEWR